MRIAIPWYMGQVFQHFGHANQFKVYELENKQVLMETIIEVETQGHSAVAELLRSLDVRAVICGNIGDRAMKALHDAGILFYAGVTGDADEAVTALLHGGLAYDPNIRYVPDDGAQGGCGCAGDCSDCGGDCGSCGGDCGGR